MEYVLLFPGQGSQYKGMYSRLQMLYPGTKELFREASDVLGFDLARLVEEESMANLTASENAQPAVIAASYALFQAFSLNVKKAPLAAAGHSLGEISACIAAGAMAFSDGIRFARKRGEIMAGAVKDQQGGAGIVVDFEESRLEGLVGQVRARDYITISAYNSPRQFIVAGSEEGLKALEEELDRAGGQLIPFKMIPMKADAPYHSRQMEYLKEDLIEALGEIEFRKPKFPIWSSVTGTLQTDDSSLRKNFEEQLTTPVYWNQVLKQISRSGADCFVDIGPGDTIRNLVLEDPALGRAFAFDSEDGPENAASDLQH
ncbi:MAG: ACP S-malonyltransferase [Hungatella sp.]|jgi:[acyl-carrier-protein] S-malonyltransferase|nr:ACP S-malonyltransferase [Hungatella sp.]